MDDTLRRAALLQACQRPQVTEVVFRTLIRWPGREISLTEVVKMTPEGGFRAAGITDLGTTLYTVVGANDHSLLRTGASRVLSKSLPFSDRELLDGLVAELLIPWNRPHETSQLYRQPDGGWSLTSQVRDDLDIFVFDAGGDWQGIRRFSGGRLRYRASLEWDGEPIPKVIRVDNPRDHHRAVRERVSIKSSPSGSNSSNRLRDIGVPLCPLGVLRGFP